MAEPIKYKIHQVVDQQGNLQVVHPETEAGLVVYEDTIGQTQVKNVNEALGALKALAQNSGVTSVNGQTGAVEVTPENIGALPSGATLDDIGDGATRKLSDYVPKTQLGANGGVATLDDGGKVPQSQLPSYVDDILEYENRLTFPATGETGKIYVAKDSNLTYRWSGSDYVIISPTIALGETSSTAYAGDKGKKNADDIAKIVDGTTPVAKAGDADKLGGVTADQYAQLSDIPEDKLFLIKGTSMYIDHSGSPVTIDKTYEQIITAIQDGKVPVLRVTATYDNRDYYYYYSGLGAKYTSSPSDIVFYRQTLYTVYSYSVKGDSTVVNTETSYAHDVIDTSSGAIISKIEMPSSVINVTRRAMENSDLPDSGVTAGAYSVVEVNSKGVVTAGNQLIEWGVDGQTTPSDNLAVGGLFFMKV